MNTGINKEGFGAWRAEEEFSKVLGRHDDFSNTAREAAKVLAERCEEYVLGINSEEILIVPVLRAGKALQKTFFEKFPGARLGLINIESGSLLTACSYKPRKVIILEPMIATGGSVKQAAQEIIKATGVCPGDIIVCSVFSSREGGESLIKEFPGLKLITLSGDHRLNDNGYILIPNGQGGFYSFDFSDGGEELWISRPGSRSR